MLCGNSQYLATAVSALQQQWIRSAAGSGKQSSFEGPGTLWRDRKTVVGYNNPVQRAGQNCAQYGEGPLPMLIGIAISTPCAQLTKYCTRLPAASCFQRTLQAESLPGSWLLSRLLCNSMVTGAGRSSQFHWADRMRQPQACLQTKNAV